MKLLKRTRGQAMLAVAVSLLAMLGLLALTMDTGRILLEHSKLQRAVDAASLAAAQDLPVSQDEELPYDVAYEAAEFNKLSRTAMDVQFTAPAGQTRLNTVSATGTKVIPTRLASILGYSQWPISAQSIARSGPIARSQHWIPIGILEDPLDSTDGLPLYEFIRLGNTTHTSANDEDIKRLYVPLDYGNLKTGVQNTITSTLKIGQTVNIKRGANIEEVCDGVGDRIKSKLGANITGCFKVSGDPEMNGVNIVGPGAQQNWYYGEDPRLVYVPFVRLKDQNTVEVIGFGLFYISYAHYDEKPYGGETGIALTEIVGYFTRSVIEGPIDINAPNYGVIGVEYVDPSKL